MQRVFVLLESGQTSPVAIFSDPANVHDFLPKDAVLLRRSASKLSEEYGHREVHSEWSSVICGTNHRLVCYKTF